MSVTLWADWEAILEEKLRWIHEHARRCPKYLPWHFA